MRSKLKAALACLALANAQSIPSDEIHSRTVPYVPASAANIKTEVRVVEVPVVVRDTKLRATAGLTKDDFQIYDEGKKQEITVFSTHNFTVRSAKSGEPAAQTAQPQTEQRRFIALCFDDLHMLPGDLVPIRQAALRFINTGLAPGDRVAIVRTSKSEKVNFISDTAELAAQIAKLTFNHPATVDDSERCIHLSPYEAYKIDNSVDPGGQLLKAKVGECSACYRNKCPETMITATAHITWDHTRANTASSLNVISSLVDGMAKLPGQRVIVLTSGGFLTGTFEADLDRLMDKARHAEVVINSLDARGLYINASAGTAYDGMGILASGTGGTFFHNRNDMEQGFRSLVPESMYVLGFSPASPPDGRFHKLKVQLADSRHDPIEARLGYMSVQPTSEPQNISKLDAEVAGSEAIADLPASFSWEQWAGPPGITVIAHLDIANLHFKPWQDRQTQKLTIVAALLDHNGNFVAGKRSELQLSFRDATVATLKKTGFTAALTIAAPPGTYSVRAVAQDAMEGKLAAASDAVTIK